MFKKKKMYKITFFVGMCVVLINLFANNLWSCVFGDRKLSLISWIKILFFSFFLRRFTKNTVYKQKIRSKFGSVKEKEFYIKHSYVIFWLLFLSVPFINKVLNRFLTDFSQRMNGMMLFSGTPLIVVGHLWFWAPLLPPEIFIDLLPRETINNMFPDLSTHEFHLKSLNFKLVVFLKATSILIPIQIVLVFLWYWNNKRVIKWLKIIWFLCLIALFDYEYLRHLESYTLRCIMIFICSIPYLITSSYGFYCIISFFCNFKRKFDEYLRKKKDTQEF